MVYWRQVEFQQDICRDVERIVIDHIMTTVTFMITEWSRYHVVERNVQRYKQYNIDFDLPPLGFLVELTLIILLSDSIAVIKSKAKDLFLDIYILSAFDNLSEILLFYLYISNDPFVS
jgi:hypothetical protein